MVCQVVSQVTTISTTTGGGSMADHGPGGQLPAAAACGGGVHDLHGLDMVKKTGDGSTGRVMARTIKPAARASRRARWPRGQFVANKLCA